MATKHLAGVILGMIVHALVVVTLDLWTVVDPTWSGPEILIMGGIIGLAVSLDSGT